jgi:hypothetical protein
MRQARMMLNAQAPDCSYAVGAVKVWSFDP